MNPTAISLAAAVLFTGVLIDVLPRRVRRGVYFGITTGPEFRATAQARDIERVYRSLVWGASVIALTMIGFGMLLRSVPLLGLAPVLQIGAMYAAWLLSREKVKPYAITPDARRVAELGPEPNVPWWMWLGLAGSFLLVLGVIAALWLNYDQLPDRFPIHYGPSGKADAFRQKSPGRVFGSSLIGLIVLVLVYANAYGLAYGCRRGGSPDARRSRAAQQRFMLRITVAIGSVIGVVFAFISAAPLFSGVALPGGGWAVGVLPVVVIAIVITAISKWSDIPKGLGDDTPDDRWLGGLFYYNPDDPAMMVEKRDSMGYTVNFAQPVGWVIAGSLLALLGSVIWMATSVA